MKEKINFAVIVSSNTFFFFKQMFAFHLVRMNFYKWFKYNNKIVLSNQYD